jgi:transposase
MAKRISWLSAAEIIGVTPRTMRRWRERLEEQGYDGLRDRRKGKASQRRVPLETCEAVLRLYQEKYFDLNVRHFHEKLQEVEGIELSYTWVKQALQGAGLVARKRRRGPTVEEDRDVRCPECCCTSTAASIAGFRTTDTTT